jgi:hypothetical protein
MYRLYLHVCKTLFKHAGLGQLYECTWFSRGGYKISIVWIFANYQHIYKKEKTPKETADIQENPQENALKTESLIQRQSYYLLYLPFKWTYGFSSLKLSWKIIPRDREGSTKTHWVFFTGYSWYERIKGTTWVCWRTGKKPFHSNKVYYQ